MKEAALFTPALRFLGLGLCLADSSKREAVSPTGVKERASVDWRASPFSLAGGVDLVVANCSSSHVLPCDNDT